MGDWKHGKDRTCKNGKNRSCKNGKDLAGENGGMLGVDVWAAAELG